MFDRYDQNRFDFDSTGTTPDLRAAAETPVFRGLTGENAARTTGTDAPLAVVDKATITENQSITLDVLANDDPGEEGELSVSKVIQPDNGRVTTNEDGTLTFTPHTGFTGVDRFRYEVADGTGGRDTATAVVRVDTPEDGGNAPPDVMNTSAEARRGEETRVDVFENASDPDGENLTLAGRRPNFRNRGGDSNSSEGIVGFRPKDRDAPGDAAAPQEGQVAFQVKDEDGAKSGGVINVTIDGGGGDENLTPVANADTANLLPGETEHINVVSNDRDPDNDSIQIERVWSANHGNIDNNKGGTSFEFTPDDGFSGTQHFTYILRDQNSNGPNDFAVGQITVNVGRFSDHPDAEGTPGNGGAAVVDTASTTAGESVTIDVAANDADTADVRAVSAPNQGETTLNDDGTITFTPSTGFTGTQQFDYTVLTENGSVDTAGVFVNIGERAGGANEAPELTRDSVAVAAGESATIDPLANDTDPNGDDLGIVDISSPIENASASLNDDGTVTVTADGDAEAAASRLAYTVSDGHGARASGRIDVSVAGGQPDTNFAPVVNDDTFTVLPGETANLEVLANDRDPDGSGVNLRSFSDPANATVREADNNGEIEFTANPGFTGTSHFSYVVDDGDQQGNTAVGQITVNVGEPAEADAQSAATGGSLNDDAAQDAGGDTPTSGGDTDDSTSGDGTDDGGTSGSDTSDGSTSDGDGSTDGSSDNGTSGDGSSQDGTAGDGTGDGTSGDDTSTDSGDGTADGSQDGASGDGSDPQDASDGDDTSGDGSGSDSAENGDGAGDSGDDSAPDGTGEDDTAAGDGDDTTEDTTDDGSDDNSTGGTPAATDDVALARDGWLARGAGDDTYLLSNGAIQQDASITISDGQGENTVRFAEGFEASQFQLANDTLNLSLDNGASITVLEASDFTFEIGGGIDGAADSVRQSFTEFVTETLDTNIPAGDSIASGEPSFVADGAADVALAESDGTVEATDDAESFILDPDGEGREFVIENFDPANDELDLDLDADVNADSLAGLDDGPVAVQQNPFTDDTIVNFGLAEDDSATTLALPGVSEPAAVDVALA